MKINKKYLYDTKKHNGAILHLLINTKSQLLTAKDFMITLSAAKPLLYSVLRSRTFKGMKINKKENYGRLTAARKSSVRNNKIDLWQVCAATEIHLTSLGKTTDSTDSARVSVR